MTHVPSGLWWTICWDLTVLLWDNKHVAIRLTFQWAPSWTAPIDRGVSDSVHRTFYGAFLSHSTSNPDTIFITSRWGHICYFYGNTIRKGVEESYCKWTDPRSVSGQYRWTCAVMVVMKIVLWWSWQFSLSSTRANESPGGDFPREPWLVDYRWQHCDSYTLTNQTVISIGDIGI